MTTEYQESNEQLTKNETEIMEIIQAYSNLEDQLRKVLERIKDSNMDSFIVCSDDYELKFSKVCK